MNNEDLISIGFEQIPHFTIGNVVEFNLDEHRTISASSVGTPNEMVFICEHDHTDHTKITDLVRIHNYDYNGYLTLEKIQGIIKFLTMK